LVVAYAIAGTVDIDFATEPIGHDSNGKQVFLNDIWPSREEIQEVEQKFVIPTMFKEVYSKIQNGNQTWNRLDSNESLFYKWNPESTYIKRPQFFDTMKLQPDPIRSIEQARVLLLLGDSVTTDHISPAGSISKSSEAAAFLMIKG
jgi:aconitate hydratase